LIADKSPVLGPALRRTGTVGTPRILCNGTAGTETAVFRLSVRFAVRFCDCTVIGAAVNVVADRLESDDIFGAVINGEGFTVIADGEVIGATERETATFGLGFNSFVAAAFGAVTAVTAFTECARFAGPFALRCPSMTADDGTFPLDRTLLTVDRVPCDGTVGAVC